MFAITSFIGPQTLLELITILIRIHSNVKMSTGSRFNISISACSISTVKYIFSMLNWIRFWLSKQWFLTYGPNGRPFGWFLHFCKTSVILIAICVSSSTVSIVNFYVSALAVHILGVTHTGSLLIRCKRTRAWMISPGVLRIQRGSSKPI